MVLTVDILHSQSHEIIHEDFPNSTILGVYTIEDQVIVTIGNGLNLPLHEDQDFALIFYQVEFFENKVDFGLHELHRIQMEEGYQVFSMDYIYSTKQWICVLADNVFDPDSRDIRVQVYSDKYVLIFEEEMTVSGFPENFYIDTYRDKTAILGWVSPPISDKLVYVEYLHNQSEGIKPFYIGQSEPSKMFWVTSMCFDEVTGNMLVFYYNGIAVLDSTLFQIANYDFFSGIQTSDHGEVFRIGDFFYSHGARDTLGSDGRRRLVLQKYDSTFNVLKSEVLGWPNQDNYPFIFNSIENQDSVLLVGGNLDGPFNGFNFFGRAKKFYLATYNLNLEQIWYKEYGGDKNYALFGLKLLSNRGAFAYGFVTDTLSDFRFAYIMHVNENGEVVSSLEVPITTGPPLTVVNPGSDQFIVLNPDHLEARVVLSSIDGLIILDEELINEVSSYNTSRWPPAVYPYIFYIDGKPVKSGKWVKRE